MPNENNAERGVEQRSYNLNKFLFINYYNRQLFTYKNLGFVLLNV